MQDIFVIALCAVICGADNWVEIEEYGWGKSDWFTEQLGLTNGIPSHDTFGAVFAAVDQTQFSECFSHWVADLAALTDGDVIAIDGKSLLRSVDSASRKAAIHLVSAWAQQNRLVLYPLGRKGKSKSTKDPTKLPPFPNYWNDWTSPVPLSR